MQHHSWDPSLVILSVVNARTGRNELHPVQHSQLSQPAFPALSICIHCGGTGAGSAGRDGTRIRAKHTLSSPLLGFHSGKHSSARSQQQLETDSLESHEEERVWQGGADAPSFSRLCLSQLLAPQCLHLTEHWETSVSPQAVPEKLIFLLMIHLPPHCIKDIKWVS